MDKFWLLFYGFTALNFILLLFTVITAGLHDIKLAKAKKLEKQRGEPFRPSVTILVPAHNEAAVIVRCLESISKLNYANYDVIVVNDDSKDNTSQLAKEYIAAHSLTAQVVDIHPNLGKGGALNYVLQHYQLGSITMVLDADCTIGPDSLQAMVNYFADGRVMAASANVRVNKESSLLAIYQQIEFIIGYYHKRHNAYTNSEFIIGGQGATYWTETVKSVGGFNTNMQTEDIDLSLRVAVRGNTRNLLIYAPDCLIYTEAVPNIKSLFSQRYRWKFGAMQALWANHYLLRTRRKELTKSLTWLRIPQAIFGEIRLFADLLFLIGFLVIAIITRSPIIFLGAWLSVTIYTDFIILADHHTANFEKLKLVIINPILFPFHIGMTMLNVVAAGKMLLHWKELFGLTAASGAWTPPDRIGREHIG